MNIEELREQWHRDADHGTDWHEQAWHLMAELDEARSELASRPKSLADYWAGRAKKAELHLGQAQNEASAAIAGYNDLARRVDDLAGQLAAEKRVLADSRRSWEKDWKIADERATKAEAERDEARGELGAMEASLKFALETNKRLKAEMGSLRDLNGDNWRRAEERNATVAQRDAQIESLAAEIGETRRHGDRMQAINVQLINERNEALAKIERIEEIIR